MRHTPPTSAAPVEGGLQQCHAVLVDFLAAIDRGQATEVLELFTHDASLDARGEQFHGRDEIASFLADREAETARQTAHLVANEVVRHADEDKIELTAMLFLHERQPGGQFRLERVLDTTQAFRRTDDGWRICRRTTAPLHAQVTQGT